MSNEELARQINAGDESLLPVLWEGVERFVYSQAYKFYRNQAGRCRAAGVEVDDLYQTGYFALLKALEVFKRKGKNKITSYMGFHLKNEFHTLVGLRTSKGRNNMLTNSMSLNEPLPDGNSTLMDIIKDESAEDEYTNALERVYQDEIKNIVHVGLKNLPQNQREIIEEIYLKNNSYRVTALNLGIELKTVKSLAQKAFVLLRRNHEIAALKDEYISYIGLRHTSLSYFKDTWTSAVEYAAMRLEREERYKSIADSVNVPLRAL